MEPRPVLTVLFVCTGNICRSPMAELFLRARAGTAPIRAFSAGTSGLVGHAMDRACGTAAQELGVDPSQHVGRRLDSATLGDADLVLAAASAHRAAAVRLRPLMFRQVFTIREFVRLGEGLGMLPAPVSRESLLARVFEVAQRRGQVPPPPAGADDIPDPFGAGLGAARTSAAQISKLVDALLATLGVRERAADAHAPH